MAFVVFASMNVARRLGLPEAIGCGVALSIIAIAIGISPATWRAMWAGGLGGDRLLTAARIVGVCGLLFLAGTRFDFAQIRRRADLIFRTLVAGCVLFVIVFLVTKLLSMDVATVVLLAGCVIASSLWLPGDFRRYAKKTDLAINWQVFALTFTACGFLVIYLAEVLAAAARASWSVRIIVLLYEAVKLFVLFGFAYYICSRFLTRAVGRVSATRTIVGFVLIAVLIFGLTILTTNELGAFAWAFVAGALWQSSKIAREFSEAHRPFGSAMLMSLAFVPLMLQPHGRTLSGWPVLALFVVSVVIIKTILARLSIKSVGLPQHSLLPLALMLSAPGEIAIGFLGFAITRWPVESQTYFVILGYALLATLLIPSMQVILRANETVAPASSRAPICQ